MTQTSPNPITKDNIDFLEKLAQRSQEAIEGYQVAETLTLTEEMRSRFANYRVERTKMLRELNVMYKVGDVTDKADVSLMSKIHQTWMKIKALASTAQREAVIEECIRGEEVTMNAYRDALETDWSPEHRDRLVHHLQTIRAHKDYLDTLR